jgi:hypothetical protein
MPFKLCPEDLEETFAKEITNVITLYSELSDKT